MIAIENNDYEFGKNQLSAEIIRPEIFYFFAGDP
jgi:hypothetical protein